MSLAYTIARRELSALLGSSTGWLLLAGWWLVAGILWVALLDQYQVAMADQVVNPYAAYRMTLTDHLFAPWFGNLTIVMLVLAPAVGMRLISAELHDETWELLATSPVPLWAIVVGKYLGALTFLGLGLALIAWMPLATSLWGRPDLGALAGGWLALSLHGAAVLAVSLLASAFTARQVVALVLAFALSMCLWMVGWLDPDPTSVASQLSLTAHVRELLRGGLRLSDLAYFLLLITWCLLATHQRLAAVRAP